MNPDNLVSIAISAVKEKLLKSENLDNEFNKLTIDSKRKLFETPVIPKVKFYYKIIDKRPNSDDFTYMYVHINFSASHYLNDNYPIKIFTTKGSRRFESSTFREIWESWKCIDLEFDVYRCITVKRDDEDEEDRRYFAFEIDWDGKQGIKIKQSPLEGCMTSEEEDNLNDTNQHIIFMASFDSQIMLDGCENPPFCFPDEVWH